MKIQYSVQFAKDARKLAQPIKTKIKELIIHLENIQNLFEIQDCKPLKGLKNSYRIRCGDYRITFSFSTQNNTIMLLRVLPRGQVYKKHIQ